MRFKFDNYARHAGKRTVRGRTYDWYDWEVFMNESPGLLQQVREVEYELHPTFPEPIRTVDDEVSRFALRSSGWGVFLIEITVLLKDGREERTEYMLDFNKTWPAGH